MFPTTKKADKKITKPTFKPTDEERALVEQMSSVGIPQESICLVISDGIDDKTLRKHFRRELDTTAIRANAAVAGALYKSARTLLLVAGYPATPITPIQGHGQR
jgi:hypothetical protein